MSAAGLSARETIGGEQTTETQRTSMTRSNSSSGVEEASKSAEKTVPANLPLSATNEATTKEHREDGEREQNSWLTRIRDHSRETLSHEDSTIPLAWQALLTGLVDALLYSKSTIWTGFQTGNMVQFSQNIAQYMLPGVAKQPLVTLERAVSVCSFIVASFVGARLGNVFGHSKRSWVVCSAIVQSIFLFGAAAILLSYDEDDPPSFDHFPAVIMFASFSMGLQSVAAQKLSSPAFATTVAFTATLTQIASDPFLFHLGLAPVEQARASIKNRRRERRRRRALTLEGQGAMTANPGGVTEDDPPATVKPKTLGRDRRMFGIFALCTGAGVAECLIQSKAGVRGGLTIAAGFKLIQALLWWTAAKGKAPKGNVA